MLAMGMAAVFASGAIAVAACGGKLVPVPADAGDAADEAPEYGDGGPFVTRVTPDSGPNSGGTQVTVDGYNFAPGQSAVAFAGFPARGSCASSTQCIVVSPYAGHQGYDQQVHVQVTVPGADGGPIMSPATPLDVFTYTAGPQCDLTLSCEGESYYPKMVITCPTSSAAPRRTRRAPRTSPSRSSPATATRRAPRAPRSFPSRPRSTALHRKQSAPIAKSSAARARRDRTRRAPNIAGAMPVPRRTG